MILLGTPEGGRPEPSASAILGALIMSVLRNGSTMMGWENYVQDIMVGVVIVGATYLDRLKERRRQ